MEEEWTECFLWKDDEVGIFSPKEGASQTLRLESGYENQDVGVRATCSDRYGSFSELPCGIYLSRP